MNLPAGIETGFEIYLNSKNELKVLDNGMKSNYTELHGQVRNIFCAEMLSDKRATDSLLRMGYRTIEAMELKFVACRFGTINQIPDLVDGKTYPDAPNCDCIGNCPGCGSVCILPEKLTRKEYQVTCEIANGKLDKEICANMKITLPTCRTYFARIREKLHTNNRIEIARWAFRIGIF